MHDLGWTLGARPTRMLDIENLPRGHVSKLLVELVHDGLGLPVMVPALVARGLKDGPVFGITCAVHGDELNGIPVVHRLFERLDVRAVRGTIVAVLVVNVPGFEANRRRFLTGEDLNHRFPGDALGNAVDVYAHRLLDRLIRHFDYLLDLHTASFGRVNSLYVRADLSEPVSARMAMLQRPQIVLDDPPSDHTLRGTADEMGIPAITVEIGNPQLFQPTYIRRALAGLRAVLCDLGLLPRRRAVTEFSEPVVCSGSFWTYTDRGGLLEVLPQVAHRVAEGEVVARLHDIFGALVAEYRAPRDGVVIGRATNPVATTGARILHLGVPK